MYRQTNFNYKLATITILLFFSSLSFVISAPMSGTYKIGGLSGSYSTISAAISDLYTSGISGDVIFKISSGVYNEQLNFNGAIIGTNNYSITFQPSTGVTSDVEYYFSSTSVADNFVVNIDGAKNLIFNNLSFSAIGSTFARVIYIENPQGDISFSNNVFESNSGVSANNYMIQCFADIQSENLHNFSFSKNLFIGGSFGIYLKSYILTKSTGLQIDKNEFQTNSSGILIENFISPQITSNISTNSGNNYAFQFNRCDGDFLVEKNKISSLTNDGMGMKFVNCNSTGTLYGNVINNFIQVSNEGLKLLISNYMLIYFNSINIEHPTLAMDNSSFAFESSSSNSNIFVHNNIFNNKREGLAYIGLAAPNNSSNNNNLYSNGINIGKWGGSNYSDLVSFIIGSSTNANSYNAVITFTSVSDLHILNSTSILYGVTVAGINTDIDEQLRNVPPLIGADKYLLPLIGTYTIGSGGFLTITEAVDNLYLRGIRGAVAFNINNGIYNEQIDLNGAVVVHGSDSSVTFQSSSGNASDVVITNTATNLANNFVLRIDAAEHIKINNLTLTAGGTDYSKVVSLENVNGNLLFYGNVMNGFLVTSNSSNQNNKSIIVCESSGNLNNSTFENNIINNGYNGIKLSLDLIPSTTNLRVIGNTISSYYRAIHLTRANSSYVISNTVSSNIGSAILLFWCDNNFIVEKNRITGSFGINLSFCDGTPSSSLNGKVTNNFISALTNGITINGSSNINVEFNNINIDTDSSQPLTNSSALRIVNAPSDLTTNIIIRNNLLLNKREGYVVNWESGQISQSDYNNLYTNGQYIARWGTIDYATLIDYSNAISVESNSYNEEVTFVSLSDLHIVNTPIPLNGVTIPSITTDIDGDLRGTPPFIGADEPSGIDVSIKVILEGPFNSPEMNASLTLPTLSPYGDGETVTSIPNISGNLVVDWVLVELRDENNSSTILESQSVFVLQDGSVVDLDGISPVHFSHSSGNYYISVKHRNHLAVMSSSSISIGL